MFEEAFNKHVLIVVSYRLRVKCQVSLKYGVGWCQCLWGL